MHRETNNTSSDKAIYLTCVPKAKAVKLAISHCKFEQRSAQPV